MRGLFIGIIVLLAIITAFSIYTYNLTSEISQDLLSNLKQLRQVVEKEQWDEAMLKLKELDENWDRADTWWTPLMDHRELDHLDQTIVRIIGFVHQCRTGDSLIEIDAATRLVERVRARESLNVKNIF
ncbi:MAG: DUF4363 family protein [Firmicutes bacterium]|nr:DUF4363 family protein [Bacillota bacterium]